jgi:hypothetical protein
MLKYLLPALHKLFNMCFSNSIYSKSWASGYIPKIQKSGTKLDPNSYRGITVTSAIDKVCNSIMNRRLEKYLTSNNIINDCQLDFTKSAQTSDHVVLKTIIDTYCKSKDLLDIEVGNFFFYQIY